MRAAAIFVLFCCSVNQFDLVFGQEFLPFDRRRDICDDIGNLVKATAVDESGLVKLRMIGKQYGAACLLHHELLDLAFAVIGFHDAFLRIQSFAADQCEIYIVVPEALASQRAGQCTGICSQCSTGTNHGEAAVHEIVHEADGIGDDGDALAPLELLQQHLAGGAGVYHDGITIVDEIVSFAGYCLLAFIVQAAAFGEWQIFAGALGNDGTAVAATKEILTFEFFEIPADGFFGDLEQLGQLGYIDFIVPAKQFHDFLSAFQTQHVDSPLILL